MRKFFLILERFFPLLKNSTIPALILGASVLTFYGFTPLENQTLLKAHYTFYALSALIGILLIYFNCNKPLFYVISIILSYMIITELKKYLGETYITNAAYINLSIILPLNLLMFYNLEEKKFFTKHNTYWLILILVELTIIEHLSRRGISFEFVTDISSSAGGLPTLSKLLFALTVIYFFLNSSINGRILDTGLFFAAIEIALSTAYSDTAGGLIIFYTAAMLTIFQSVCEHIYYVSYHDLLTGFSNRNAFLRHAPTFPLKYSVGLILIDDYERLSKIFGRHGISALIKMISLRLDELENEAQIYRYNVDEFIILYRGQDKNEAYEKTEQIRRGIAGTEFCLRGYNKPIKLTVSGAVSEKKRSDADAVEVIYRANKALQKANRFTQNITTKA